MSRNDKFHKNMGTAGAAAGIGSCCIAGNDSFCLMYPAIVTKFLRLVLLLTSTSKFDQPNYSESGHSTKLASFSTGLILGYQRWWSSRRPDRCALSPTCSNYALAVWSRGRFVEGVRLTCQRLLECHSSSVSPTQTEPQLPAA